MITRFFAVALSGCALALAGCGDDAGEAQVIGPATTPPSAAVSAPASPSGPGSPSASGTRSPAASPSRGSATDPAAGLDEATKRELLSVPVRYYEAIERAYSTLDYSEVEALSSEKCEGCQAQLNYLKEAAREKYQHEGGAHTVKSPRIMGRVEDGRWAVGATVDYETLTVKDAEGQFKERAEGAANQQEQINLGMEKNRWVVIDIYALDN